MFCTTMILYHYFFYLMALGSLNELFSLPFVDSFKIEVKEKLDANACQVIFSAQFTFYNFR